MVVVGAGITGLAAAYHLQEECNVTVLEAADRVGGKLGGDEMCGVPVDTGPDCFLARVPWAVDLCRRLGIADELVPPATETAYVWARGRLHPLPAGLVMGVPSRLAPVLAAGILSPLAKARATLDLVLPRSRFPGPDPSVASVVGRRFGPELVARLADPLLGGINAGRSDHLSLMATAPVVAAVARRHRSLALGLRRQRRAAAAAGAGCRPIPTFLTFPPRLSDLAERLSAALTRAPRQSTPVAALAWDLRRGYRVVPGGEPRAAPLRADGVVVATGARAAARLLGGLSPGAARELGDIRHSSVVTVTLAYPAWGMPPLAGSGFLVPRVEGRLLTACTWLSQKWPHMAAPGVKLLRASAGRAEAQALELTDGALIDRAHGELAEAMGLTARPTEALVTRWVDAFPQYEVGHLARVGRIEAALDGYRGLAVAGAAYPGVGVAACVRQGGEAAGRVSRALLRPGRSLAAR